MPRSYGSAELLAHEIGHYLQLVHSFVDGVKTVKKAAEKIKHHVQEENHPDSEGLNVLDGDRAWVLDTPPDARGSIFEPERSARRDFITYVRDDGDDLKPIRWRVDVDNNKQTVLKRCGAYNLGDAPVQDITGCGLALEVAISAIRDKKGHLRLTAWFCRDRADHVEARGSAQAGTVGDVAMCRMGTRLVVTGVRTASGKLKLILWHTSKDGNHIVRRESAGGPTCDEVEMCYAGANKFVTAIRDGWNVTVTSWRLEAPTLPPSYGEDIWHHIFAGLVPPAPPTSSASPRRSDREQVDEAYLCQANDA